MACFHAPNCEYNHTTHQCARPHPWITYLRAFGKSGLTRHQLSNNYNILKQQAGGPGPNFNQRICRLAHRAGRSFNREMPVANVCNNLDNIIPQHPQYQNNFLSIWNKIYQDAKKAVGGRWTDDWQQANFMTIDRLNSLLALIDKYFFRNTLRAWFQAIGRPFTFQIANIGNGVAARAQIPLPNQAAIQFDSNVILQTQMPVVMDGTHLNERLHWVAHIMGHEIIHHIVRWNCGQTFMGLGGHGNYFRLLNNRIFGHSANYYVFGQGNAIVA